MPNPFSGIITPALKTTFNNMIDALLEEGACTVPCTLVFGGQKFVACSNCAGGIYVPGGPIPFPNGKICPLCNNKPIQVEETEEVHLMVIFDSKKWRTMAATTSPKTFNELAETMCHMTLYPKLKAAKHVILNNTNELYSRNVYKRMGEPEPCGFGDMRYILTAWERVN